MTKLTSLAVAWLAILFFAPLRLVAGSVEQTPHTRQYFYVGGEYVVSTTGEHVMKNEMYIEELTPVGGSTKPFPLIFIHGLGQTGTNWLNTPDGRPGWASYFLAHGYQIYLIDQPSRGRSSWLPPPNNDTTLTAITAEAIEQRFTAPELSNLWPQAHLHTAWPDGYGNGTRGHAAFDAYYASLSPSIIPPVTTQTLGQNAGIALLDRISRKVILIAHSQGTAVAVLLADKRPSLVKALVLIEAAGPPFIEPILNGGTPARAWGMSDIPVSYTPPVSDPNVDIIKKVIVSNSTSVENCSLQDESKGVVRKMTNLQGVQTLLVTGEASWHMLYDWCTTKFLQQAGVKAEQVRLVDRGILGNGHMMFMETNSEQIAGVVGEWMGKVEVGV